MERQELQVELGQRQAAFACAAIQSELELQQRAAIEERRRLIGSAVAMGAFRAQPTAGPGMFTYCQRIWQCRSQTDCSLGSVAHAMALLYLSGCSMPAIALQLTDATARGQSNRCSPLSQTAEPSSDISCATASCCEIYQPVKCTPGAFLDRSHSSSLPAPHSTGNPPVKCTSGTWLGSHRMPSVGYRGISLMTSVWKRLRS